MKNVDQSLDTAFDLSYLSSYSFPNTEFKSVVILGGGTAGYLAALSLKKSHPELDVQIVESKSIPVIGVGESTTTEILPFLHNFLGIDPEEFFREVKPSLKFGIEFDWGKSGDKNFNFNFFAGHQYESYFYEGSIENANWPSVLIASRKIPILKRGEFLQSFLPNIPFSYHLDNKRLIAYLQKKVLDVGVQITEAIIEEVELYEDKNIKSLKDSAGQQYSADFYIDCSGFRSKLLGETLNTKFISFESSLITDTALTFSLPNNDQIDPFTSVLTMKNGWCWKIPMREEDHYGYVFSSKFCSELEAKLEIEQKFNYTGECKKVSFRSGRHDLAWNKNVFSLGNSYAFIEPLESTAIQSIIQSCLILCRLMPNSLSDMASITGINKEIAANWDSFRAFLAIHYKFNEKLDTPFWDWCRQNTDLRNAEVILGLFKERPPLSRGNFGNSMGYIAYDALSFNSFSYDSILLGQKLLDRDLAPPKMSKEEYGARVDSYHSLTSECITQFDLFRDEDFSIQEIFIPLFEDPESWVNTTEM